MQYWWFSVLVAAIAVGLVALVVWLHRHLRASYIVAMCVGTVLILYKTCEFSYYRAIGHPEYPVEFSHISYFIIGATMLTGVKKMRFFAAFCGSAGGIGYLIATILSPDSMVTEMSSTYYVVMAVVQHELLFFVGLLLMFDVQRHSYRDIWVPIVGTVAIVGFSLHRLCHRRREFDSGDTGRDVDRRRRPRGRGDDAVFVAQQQDVRQGGAARRRKGNDASGERRSRHHPLGQEGCCKTQGEKVWRIAMTLRG